jgi:hypothetical protein
MSQLAVNNGQDAAVAILPDKARDILSKIALEGRIDAVELARRRRRYFTLDALIGLEHRNALVMRDSAIEPVGIGERYLRRHINADLGLVIGILGDPVCVEVSIPRERIEALLDFVCELLELRR